MTGTEDGRMRLEDQERLLGEVAATLRVLEDRGDPFLLGQYRHLRERAEALAVLVEGPIGESPLDTRVSSVEGRR